ncbi:MAG: MFS transporter [Eubacteriales bacterium]|nr:MFS transporter [Eubacteriales bacterium]
MGSSKLEKRRQVICIIVLLFANSSAGGAEWCTSALADIAARFPDVPYSIITLVNNIPNLCAVIFTVVAGVLVNRKIALKHMLLIGIGCHCVGGVLPALFGNTSIAMVFIGRLAFGIGYGLMQGIGISMSFKLVTDERLREHAMGWAVTAQYAMNMLAQVIVGYLCAIQWNYSFYIYLWSALSFIVVLLLCPDFPLDKRKSDDTGTCIGQGESIFQSIKLLPSTVWAFTAIVAVYMFSYYPMFLVVSPIINDRGFGNSVSVGYAMIFYSVATIFGGVIFGFVAKTCKHWTLCIFMTGVAVSLLGLYFSNSYTMVCIFLFLSGITSTGIIPACINVYYNQVPESRSFLATGITEAGVNIGAFLGTPYIAMLELFGANAVSTMIISPLILIVLGLVSVRYSRKAAI